MNQLLTISQIAKMLKIKGSDPARKCRNLLRAIETKRGVTVMIEQNNRFYTTEPLLQSVLPELFQDNSFQQETIQGMKETIMLLTQKVNALTVRLAEIEGSNGKQR